MACELLVKPEMFTNDEVAVCDTVRLMRPACGACPLLMDAVATELRLEVTERVLKLAGVCKASSASLKLESLDWKEARALILRLELCSLLSISVTGFCSTAISWLTIPATSIVDPPLPVELDELVDEMATVKF